MKKSNKNKYANTGINLQDGIQELNNQVTDAHPIESETLANGLFHINIQDKLIDPSTKWRI